MKAFPYHVHTHYSVQRAFCHIDELVARAYELEFPALALTDMHSLSGIPEFLQEIEKINKTGDHKIKPMVGCDFLVDVTDVSEIVGDDVFVTCIARNREGWINLIKILSKTKYSKKEPMVTVNTLKLFSDNIVFILNGLTQALAPDLGPNCFFSYESRFNGMDRKCDLPELVTQPVYYVLPEDQLYQQIIICSQHKKTLEDVPKLIEEYPDYHHTINEDNNICYLQEFDEYETRASQQLFDMVEPFSIAQNPKIPSCRDENNVVIEDAEAKLLELCREGWKNRNLSDLDANPELKEVYVNRIKEELTTFRQAGISTYILIIWDIVQYAKKQNIQVGLRGSASGCLISYFIGISDIDPVWPDKSISYDADRSLLFSRFFNKGRMSEGHISLADIDLDIEPSFRDELIEFVEKKYGSDCVAYIITFGRLDGKGAIKEIFRVLGKSFDIANTITKEMIDAHKISDIIEDLRKDDPKYNVINYCIDHQDDIKNLYTQHKREFDIAIKIASTIRTQGRHAAGIVIGNQPLGEWLPVISDEKDHNKKIVALEMAHAEYCGAVKYDFLGVAALEKIHRIIDMINTGDNEPKVGNLSFSQRQSANFE